MTQDTQGLVDIGKLVLQFARIDRATLHEDGVTPESDTDHTVMLSVSACSLASALYSEKLDVGKVAQFAIVHDLVEAYAGDTNTFNISNEEKIEKENREELAYEKIKSQFNNVYPWIPVTIQEYEDQTSLEAKFVKLVDKVMAKLTHSFNEGASLKKMGKSKEETIGHFTSQAAALEEQYGTLFPEIINILKHFVDDTIRKTYS